MFNKILKYLNQHPLIGLITIIALGILLWHVTSRCDNNINNYEQYETTGDGITNGDQSVDTTNGDQSVDTTNGDQPVDMTNGDQSVDTTNGDQSVDMTNGDQSVDMTNGDQSVDMTNGDQSVDMTNGDGITNSDEENLPKDFYPDFVGNNKMINFVCTYKGEDYYLACCKVSNCTKQIVALPMLPDPDCDNVSIILIKKNDVIKSLDEYLLDNNDNELICNFKKQLACKREKLLKKVLEKEEEQNGCPLPTDETCKQKRMYVHDFVVSEIFVLGDTSTKDITQIKYLVRGTAAPLVNGSSFATLLNQHVASKFGLSTMCGDDYPYGADENEKEFGELMIEKIDPNINNGEKQFKILLKYATTDNNINRDPITNKIVVTPKIVAGIPQKKTTYMGVGLTTCMFNGFECPRVVLYDDKNNENVLSFIPKLVQ
jgi:hypothetical protein